MPPYKLKLKVKLRSWPKDINKLVGESSSFQNERNIEIKLLECYYKFAKK